jgi:YD repeat-containing protein
MPGGAKPLKASFQYDGLGRLASATENGFETRRRYDSLSQLLAESQGGREIHLVRDSAGNAVSIRYPSGHAIMRDYDLLNRLTRIVDCTGAAVAKYSYRAGLQRSDAKLGRILDVAYDYEPCRNRLRQVVYRRAEDGEVLERRPRAAAGGASA